MMDWVATISKHLPWSLRSINEAASYHYSGQKYDTYIQ